MWHEFVEILHREAEAEFGSDFVIHEDHTGVTLGIPSVNVGQWWSGELIERADDLDSAVRIGIEDLRRTLSARLGRVRVAGLDAESPNP